MDDYKKLLFIINPVSGRKKGLPYVTDILRIFYEYGYLTTTMLTTERGDATKYTIEYGTDFDIIVCLGGDGTLNEVCTGLGKAGIHIPVGYIPAGSTNDFAECHELSTKVLEAAVNIMEKESHASDLGKLHDGYFTYVAAVGALASLSYSTSQKMKNKFGHAAYFTGALPVIMKLRTTYLKVTDDEGNVYEGDYIYGSALNSTSLAGTFDIPKEYVDTADGIFEVFLVKKPKNIKDFYDIVTGMFSQNYDKTDSIQFFRSKSLHIETGEDETDWTLDGEHYKAPPVFDIENMHQFISIKG